MAHQEAVRPRGVFSRVVNADPGACRDQVLVKLDAVILYPDPVAQKACAACFRRDVEGLRERPGTGQQGPVCGTPAASLLHQLDPLERLPCPDEDGVRRPGFSRHDVEQVVNAITEIHVCRAALAEHRLRALRSASAPGVARPVADACVRFRFRDHRLCHGALRSRAENFAEKLTAYLHDVIAAVESTIEFHNANFAALPEDCVAHFDLCEIRAWFLRRLIRYSPPGKQLSRR